MSTTTTLVATLTTLSEHGDELADLPDDVGMLEVRADLVGDLDVDWLRQRFAGQLLYTLRSAAEGGEGSDDPTVRARRVSAAAAAGYDLIDLEAERDRTEAIFDAVPRAKRLVSWHGVSSHLQDLRDRFHHVAARPARYYTMIPTAAGASDGVHALALLRELKRDDLVLFAAGAQGTWTRPLAPRLGSPLVYGAFGGVPGAPGQLSIARLRRDYGLPALPPVERLYGIVGRPVLHSLSPRLHNGAYRAFDLPALYVPFHAESFGDFWIDVVESGSLEALGLPLGGLSVTAPYKAVALAVSGASSPRAQHINAANTLVCHEGVWEAESTDPEGVTEALRARGATIEGRTAAVVGCGGAGKAAAFGLQLAGGRVTLINRGRERGMQASEELHLPFVPLDDFDPAAYDVIVHATALGHHDDDPLPFATDALDASSTVVEMVYGREPTPLVRAAEAQGAVAIDGRDVLLYQALGQFRLMTRRVLDAGLARQLLDLGELPPRPPSANELRPRDAAPEASA
ncbi:MAG: type I 3-dehydroquinate dehydratase [Acidobacteriota bacterium]